MLAKSWLGITPQTSPVVGRVRSPARAPARSCRRREQAQRPHVEDARVGVVTVGTGPVHEAVGQAHQHHEVGEHREHAGALRPLLGRRARGSSMPTCVRVRRPPAWRTRPPRSTPPGMSMVRNRAAAAMSSSEYRPPSNELPEVHDLLVEQLAVVPLVGRQPEALRRSGAAHGHVARVTVVELLVAHRGVVGPLQQLRVGAVVVVPLVERVERGLPVRRAAPSCGTRGSACSRGGSGSKHSPSGARCSSSGARVGIGAHPHEAPPALAAQLAEPQRRRVERR